MTVIKQNKHEPHATEIGLQPVATSVVTNFTPLYVDNIQQKLNNEYVLDCIYKLSKGESEISSDVYRHSISRAYRISKEPVW